MRFLLLIAFAFLLPAPAFAELTQLRASAAGQAGQIFIGFDSQPQSVALEQTASGARLMIEGVRIEERRISPAHDELVLSVSLTPLEEGAQIDLIASGIWDAVRADVYRGGVLVSVTLRAAIDAPRAAAMPPGLSDPSIPDAGASAPAMSAPASASETAETARQEAVAMAEPAPTSQGSETPPTPENVTPPSLCEAAEAAVAADPWNDAALIQHAQCLREAGNVVAAAGIYEQMLAFEPENAAIAFALAQMQEAAGNHEAAARTYRQAAAHARSDAEAAAAINRARALEGQ